MRALRYHRYGSPDVLKVEDVPEPQASAGQVKVRVRAAGLNPLDWKIRAGHLRIVPTLHGPPRGIGCDFAGEVVAAGPGIVSPRVGERVFGSLQPFGRDGALAEAVVVGADTVVPIPDALTFEDAAALPIAGGTALQVLTDRPGIRSGQRVLITGAAGGVGHLAVQIAKHAGAHVVGVCSAANAGFVRDLGADEVVDYSRSDFTRRSDRFDLVFDAACASSFAAARGVLTDSGCYVSTAGSAMAAVGTVAGSIFARLTSRQQALAFMLDATAGTWQRLAAMAQSGALRVHIARRISLEEVAAAMREMETGHGRGKTVVCL